MEMSRGTAYGLGMSQALATVAVAATTVAITATTVATVATITTVARR